MKKRNVFLLLLILTSLLSSYESMAEPGPFEQHYLTIQEKAVEQNKPYIILFSAQWCTPCQWMEERTFSDKEVQQIMNNDFLAAKVDIDDFDGFAIKDKYNVKVLPTILIFDANGSEKIRYEKSMTANEMKALLKDYKAGKITQPQISNPATTHPTPQSEPVPAAGSDSPVFRVQTGVYSSFSTAKEQMEKLRTIVNSPVHMEEVMTQGKVVYKVQIGNFQARSAAESLKAELKSVGITGFVKECTSGSRI